MVFVFGHSFDSRLLVFECMCVTLWFVATLCISNSLLLFQKIFHDDMIKCATIWYLFFLTQFHNNVENFAWIFEMEYSIDLIWCSILVPFGLTLTLFVHPWSMIFGNIHYSTAKFCFKPHTHKRFNAFLCFLMCFVSFLSFFLSFSKDK